MLLPINITFDVSAVCFEGNARPKPNMATTFKFLSNQKPQFPVYVSGFLLLSS
jgi:hypothetical protein